MADLRWRSSRNSFSAWRISSSCASRLACSRSMVLVAGAVGNVVDAVVDVDAIGNVVCVSGGLADKRLGDGLGLGGVSGGDGEGEELSERSIASDNSFSTVSAAE